MQYRKLEGIDQKLSVLIYGTPWTACRKDMRDEAYCSYDHAWEAGFRAFDTANSYGDGEETLGAWLHSRGIRGEAVIIDKGCNPGQNGSTDTMSAETIRNQVEKSLVRLQTDHVDFYLLHRDDPKVPVDEIIDVLNEKQREGKIRRFGVSNWSLRRVLAAEEYAVKHHLTPFTAFSPAYSLAEYLHDPWGGSISISGEKNKAYRDWLEHTQFPVFCYSSLGRGYLSGKFRTDGDEPIEKCLPRGPIMEYDGPVNRERLRRAESLAKEKGTTVPKICLAWLLRQPQQIFPLVAPTSEAHIRDTAGVFETELTDGECRFLIGLE